MESDMLLLGGMVLAISGFLAFDYKERKPWQKMIFGMLYIFFGTVFVCMAGTKRKEGAKMKEVGFDFSLKLLQLRKALEKEEHPLIRQIIRDKIEELERW